MTKLILLIILLLCFNEQFLFAQRFSADTVKQTIDDVTKELSLKQPGFYRYTSKEEFGKYIDSVKLTITDSLTESESYLKFKAIISKIHCLHTGISLPKNYTDSIHKLPVLFPFQLYFINNKVYVIKNYSNNKSILTGDEIVSINGQHINSIVDRLLTFIPSDGYNLTMKYRALYYQFPTWYRYIDQKENFIIVIKQNNVLQTYQIKGSKFNDIAEDGFLKEPLRSKQLEFKIENNIGFLTIHSFAKTEIQKAKQEFKPFINEIFIQLKANKIKNLIVDLRDNTGGSDPYAEYFASYFFDNPFRYWDRIVVTEAIAKEIKGIALTAFYKKPIQKDSVWLWQKGKHTNEFDFYEEQQPAKNNYKGNTYILINGFCMSSCSDVTAILAYNKKATFIGEETGGGYQGNNSGMIPDTKVTPFNFTLSVPLQEYFNYVDTSKNIGRGTIPDYPVYPSTEDIIKGNDTQLDFTTNLIKINKQHSETVAK
ncbi:MAG: S41 family peptidase [Parafilimonas sp.]